VCVISYPVQAAEGHVDGQGEQILDHFLERLHQLLLVGLDLLRLEAQQDPHGDAEHQPLHLRVDQDAGVLGHPLLHRGRHLLLDDGDVEIQSLGGESAHDGLEMGGSVSQITGRASSKRTGTGQQNLLCGLSVLIKALEEDLSRSKGKSLTPSSANLLI